jgi:hypothetical protein
MVSAAGAAAPDPAFSVLHVGAVGHTGLLGPVCDPCVVSSCLDDTKKENVVNPIMIDGMETRDGTFASASTFGNQQPRITLMSARYVSLCVGACTCS